MYVAVQNKQQAKTGGALIKTLLGLCRSKIYRLEYRVLIEYLLVLSIRSSATSIHPHMVYLYLFIYLSVYLFIIYLFIVYTLYIILFLVVICHQQRYVIYLLHTYII